ncbi:hypothetical protein ABIF38_007615 [Bradyrhizobium japonicum]|uniref:Uncharacterized protein n=1 Tax=Bradyrhizobium elkanii TaxID=29448 RepID=A0A8I1YI96_BRAEL|nr:hypothetical protein [Bradyrhizobium elkanii]MCP1834267.1 hypothetical protein [Bradyrhizobium sp. USDA 4545]MCP1919013.1 hypothetical protein [Bradyrhizobium sp. USDA 4532]MCS4006144.1 hypothetical protein [Bradyrhizobium elkanii USDA 61]MBP2427704.1 hypothetical protein [Bradyrhizobium elkanii]
MIGAGAMFRAGVVRCNGGHFLAEETGGHHERSIE